MNYFKQIIYEMKHHKMMTWVSISGTALSIFLVMAFFITDNIVTVDIEPETDRGRLLSGQGIHIHEGDNDSSGMGIAPGIAEQLYSGLEGIEKMSYMMYGSQTEQMSQKGQEPFMARGHKVDHNFWKMFDFRFIDGMPFDSAQVAAGEKVVVISRNAARRLFGEDHVAGRMIELRMLPYRVVGVVENVNQLATFTAGDYYTGYNKSTSKSGLADYQEWFGDVNVLMKMKEGYKPEDIKRQVENRYERLRNVAKKDGKDIVYHSQPYTVEELKMEFGSNTSPNLKMHKRVQYIIYLVVLLLPAINLSSMTRSRLRHRVSEIGVRRAFGAKRNDIVLQLFGENFLITCIGGLIGFVMCMLFLMFASHLFFNYSGDFFMTSLDVLNTTPDLGLLFKWENFLAVLVFCFVLNVISATIPAWRASAKNPAEAISGSH